MEEWKDYEISELIQEIAMGPFGSNIKVDNFVDFGVPVLNGSNLRGYKLNEDSFNYVTEEKANSLSKANAYRGDVVITHRGTLGQIVFIPANSKFDRYVISQSQFRLKLKSELIRPDYLVYFFHTRIGQHYIMMNASQVGVPALARPSSTFQKISIPVPPINVQNKIMELLLSLDDKIELNKRINDNLEQQAQALFRHWFVDFGPFKNGEFVESELGMIPKGWSVGRLGELLEIKYGKDHKKLSEGLYPVYGSGGLMRMVDKKLFEGESVLIPRKGTLNNVMYVNEAFWTVDTMFYSIPKVDNVILYSYIFLSFKDLSSMNAGSAVPSMTTEILNNMQIVIPTKDVLFEFNVIVSSYYSQINQKEKESTHLATLRDTLLPKLMSGQIKL